MAVTWMHNPEDGQDYPADTPVEKARLRALGYTIPDERPPEELIEEPVEATPPQRLSRARREQPPADPPADPPACGVNAPDGSV